MTAFLVDAFAPLFEDDMDRVGPSSNRPLPNTILFTMQEVTMMYLRELPLYSFDDDIMLLVLGTMKLEVFLEDCLGRRPFTDHSRGTRPCSSHLDYISPT